MSLQAIEKEVLQLAEEFNGKFACQIVWDEEIIDYHSDERFQSASLIKIPMIVEGFRQAEAKEIYLNQPVTIRREQITGGSGVLHALSDKVFLTLEDLLTLMITVSDNTSTNILIDLLGFDKINQCCRDLGLKNTVLERKMFDFKAKKEGKDNFITAADTITSLKAIHTGSVLSKESHEKILRVFENQQFREKLPARMGKGVKVAGKTGGIQGVSHDAAILRSDTQTVYAAVLTEEITSDEDSRQVMGKIGKLLYDEIMKRES
ncbi:serine hydrolase [Bacillus massiliglaciei]|uniref:serine hydrolase n=1 Tax=Bacillus massiliglaciei TaxID=1816693 RepID=UPI000AA7E597|nr:serine hydrolase [Bacillus massiliglaciei]